ncbi:MAG TPA: propionate catabolism operon regulatory protein PrpR [Anaeromyxobacteraceae bacterium]|jgi:propionate catabolism operon transcriptional regulator|nr:propionate catabolism operon regulatory protein PrpR [Anaeromyxobacteraceae bacterium]
MPFRSDRKPIIWAFSASRLRKVLETAAPLYADRAEVRVFDRSFEDALETARSLTAAEERVDAFVAAGSNGTYLRDHAPVPVALVDVSTADALQALALARTLGRRIGVVNFKQVLPGLERWRVLLHGVQIEQRTYVTLEEARAAVTELAARGYEVVVGPGPACELAEAAGLQSVLLYSFECVCETIERAIEMAQLLQAERERREQLASVIDHVDEAVVAVDASERISVVNPGTERLLGMKSADLLGKRLSSVAPELGLSRVLETGAAELRTFQKLGGRSLVVSRIPVRQHGVLTGAVLTCQDSRTLLRVDRDLRSELRPRRFIARYELAGIVGDSAAIRTVRTLAERYAATEGTVLITGESGTGKEMVAQGIHSASRRRDRPFVAINCAAFPEALLESELFGYEEGAFTGSRRGGRAGLFEAAHTGTIFLDEVGDVPVTLQTRLLRVLQERQVLRLGSNDPTPIDVRVVAATNRDLKKEIARGAFREDLYYRLAILPILVPPLRARREDVAPIAEALLRDALSRHGAPDVLPPALGLVLPWLEGYAWPGNVRELENVLERVAVLYSHHAAAPERVESDELRAVLPELFQPPATAPEGDLRSARGAEEAAVIRRALGECGGNVSEAAKRLGVGRSTLYRKLRAPG